MAHVQLYYNEEIYDDNSFTIKKFMEAWRQILAPGQAQWCGVRCLELLYLCITKSLIGIMCKE